MEKAGAYSEVTGYGASKEALVKVRRKRASEIAKVDAMRGHERNRKNSLVEVQFRKAEPIIQRVVQISN